MILNNIHIYNVQYTYGIYDIKHNQESPNVLENGLI